MDKNDLDLLRRVADALWKAETLLSVIALTAPSRKAKGEISEAEKCCGAALTALRALISRLAEPQDREAGVTGREPYLLAAIRWAHDTLYEINPSNYDDDEVSKLNSSSVEVILGLARVLGERHGKTEAWWKEQPLPAFMTPATAPQAVDAETARLVERLQDLSCFLAGEDGWSQDKVDLLDEAADTIAALSAQRTAAEAELKAMRTVGSWYQEKDIDALEERAAKAEEALRTIAGGSFLGASNFAIANDWHGFAVAVQRIAREALEQGGKK